MDLIVNRIIKVKFDFGLEVWFMIYYLYLLGPVFEQNKMKTKETVLFLFIHSLSNNNTTRQRIDSIGVQAELHHYYI